MERLKQPKRSPASESAPHWRTIAPGTYVSTTLEITYNIEIYEQKFAHELGGDQARNKRHQSRTSWLIDSTYTFKESREANVIYSIFEWDIYSIELAFSFSYFLQYKQ